MSTLTSEDRTKCPTCEGFGFIDHGSGNSHTCTRCEGKGMVSSKDRLRSVLRNAECPHWSGPMNPSDDGKVGYCVDGGHCTCEFGPALRETRGQHETFKCKANRTADPPQDCDWPHCGCDPAADRVLAALQEEGFTLVNPSRHMPKRERPQEAPNKSQVQYTRELVTYCGLTQSATFGLPYSRELQSLLEQLVDAKDDALRLHHAYVDLKFPQALAGKETPAPPTNPHATHNLAALAAGCLCHWCVFERQAKDEQKAGGDQP